MSRVFLGGTCNNSNWRSVMEDLLEGFSIDFFNPVVEDWSEEDYKNELREREECDFLSLCNYAKNERSLFYR